MKWVMSAAIAITVLVAIYGVSVFRHHATTPDMALAVKSGGADAGHEDHDDHDEHDGLEASGEHDHLHSDAEHDESGTTTCLSDQVRKDVGIELAVAGPGDLHVQTALFGEVILNRDKVAHVVPLVPGVVREIRKSPGDSVKEGQVMAIIHSQELSDARAAFLAARARRELAETTLKREEGLWKKKITSEQEYLEARQGLAEATINMKAIEQTLRALGLSDREVKELHTSNPPLELTRYAIRAPIAGTVINREISIGEKVDDGKEVFIIADLGSVWVDLKVPQKSLPYVREGDKVTIFAQTGSPSAEGVVSYVSPIVGEQTRMSLARIVLPNPVGEWRPGLFVTAELTVHEETVPLLVPKAAVQRLDGETVVFVETEGRFETRPVAIGRSNTTYLEVLSGLNRGETYVAEGAFSLKAKIITSDMDPHAGHGH
ncbi:MAG: efflux RND transporter periplasmic adaptor subunit [Deltaproteobacteria bacterium]|nr:efflux RND transporter periplasmic adaptor subunit [Deltaproteobacteria bacterium]